MTLQSTHCSCLGDVQFLPRKADMRIWRLLVLRIPNEHITLHASEVLGVVIRSVCLSISHMSALWQNQTMHCGYFDTKRKGNRSSFWTPTLVGGWRFLPSEICAQSDPPPSKYFIQIFWLWCCRPSHGDSHD